MSGSDIVDATTFGSYSLQGAYVHRLFLPLASTAESPIEDPPTSRWGPLARAAGIELDAGTECRLVLGWGRGDGQGPPLRPSQGRAPLRTLEGIRRLTLHAATVGHQQWQLRSFEAPTPHTIMGNRQVGTDLERFFGAWEENAMPGALRLGNEVLLDAPRYADSVIVSAPKDLTAVGAQLGLEIVRASPSRHLPCMTW